MSVEQNQENKPKYDIIGVGSPIVDALAQVGEDFLSKHLTGAKGGMELVSGEEIARLAAEAGTSLVESPGGSAGNTIFGLARLGISSTFLGKIGNDQTGHLFTESFRKMGGDTSRLKKSEEPTGRCVSLVTPDSERTMRTHLGAALTLSPEEISEEDFQGCRHAHIEGYLLFNRDLLRHVLGCAKRAGCTVSLDLASFEVVQAAEDILPEILKEYVDIVFANEEEAEAFLGKGKSYPDMARELHEYCEIGVVKMGKAGSVVASREGVVEIEPLLVEDVVDTTGAGDLWAAGFLYGWLRSQNLAACGGNGSRLGAEVVRRMGTIIPPERWVELSRELA
ncbi:MAG: adenosine kinase [Opitutales bacterium]|nr:adenosine kinase [Opitutales bacterium]